MNFKQQAKQLEIFLEEEFKKKIPLALILNLFGFLKTTLPFKFFIFTPGKLNSMYKSAL